ncbi:hypothetical protein ACOME3_007810 [Neoechinorhynchus agilis]
MTMRRSIHKAKPISDFIVECIGRYYRGELEFEASEGFVDLEDSDVTIDRDDIETMENIEETKDDRREVGFTILKNKGVLPKRKKELRNPRVHHRKRYARALAKRKAQVPSMRNRDKPYEGEPTGIRTRVKRSIKLK